VRRQVAAFNVLIYEEDVAASIFAKRLRHDLTSMMPPRVGGGSAAWCVPDINWASATRVYCTLLTQSTQSWLWTSVTTHCRRRTLDEKLLVA